MKRFGIFEIKVNTKEERVTISFVGVPNPLKSELLKIEAGNIEEALAKARELLKMFGVKTHSLRGDLDTMMNDFPSYFVGELNTGSANMYDTESLMFEIYNFTPVPKD